MYFCFYLSQINASQRVCFCFIPIPNFSVVFFFIRFAVFSCLWLELCGAYLSIGVNDTFGCDYQTLFQITQKSDYNIFICESDYLIRFYGRRVIHQIFLLKFRYFEGLLPSTIHIHHVGFWRDTKKIEVQFLFERAHPSCRCNQTFSLLYIRMNGIWGVYHEDLSIRAKWKYFRDV